jgi:hypothetical protein
MDNSKTSQSDSNMADTDGEPKAQKKQVCRFFTSKGKCSTILNYTRYGRLALVLHIF